MVLASHWCGWEGSAIAPGRSSSRDRDAASAKAVTISATHRCGGRIREAEPRRKRRGSAVITVLRQAPFRLVLAQLGRLISPEPGAPPPGDPKFLPADVPELMPDQILEMRYGRGRAEPRWSVR